MSQISTLRTSKNVTNGRWILPRQFGPSGKVECDEDVTERGPTASILLGGNYQKMSQTLAASMVWQLA